MTTSLRELIATSSPVMAPAIYDGISALVLKEFGFPAAYIGSYGTGAAKYGLPDIGYIGVEDMADMVRRLAPVAEVPIIVDGEGGWGNPLHVARSVKLLERAGAAATHIEDHEFGKHITAKPRVISTRSAADKIKAALDARDSDDFMIVARTDSSGTEGPEAAVDRVLAYQEAGADGLFVAGLLDAASKQRLKAEATVPIFNTNWYDQSADEQAADGTSVILYYALGHMAATQGIRSAFSTLARDRTAIGVEAGFGGIQAIIGYDDFLGIPAAREAAEKYGLLGE